MKKHYSVIESHYRKRWRNRNDFIHHTVNNTTKQHTHTLLILCYNNIDQFFGLLEHISQEPLYEDFAITIIQNSDKQESIDAFEKRIWLYKETIVIYPIENIWSAWWYALWHEYCMNSSFSHCIIIEDDIQLYENNTISTTIKHSISHSDDVVFINAPDNTWWAHSRYVQYACYPLHLLRVIWGIDPRYYFRAEDLERWLRIEYWIKQLQLQKHILPFHYYHPYIKASNNSGSWIYFSLRNQAWTILSYKSMSFYFCLVVIQYIQYGLLVLCRSRKNSIIIYILKWIYDWVHSTKDLPYNKYILSLAHNKKPVSSIDIGHIPMSYNILQQSEMINTKNYIAKTTFSIPDKRQLDLYNWHIPTIGWLQPVWGAILSLLSKIYIIEHIQLDKNIIKWFATTQTWFSRIYNLLLFFPLLLISSLIGLLWSIYIFCLQYKNR